MKLGNVYGLFMNTKKRFMYMMMKLHGLHYGEDGLKYCLKDCYEDLKEEELILYEEEEKLVKKIKEIAKEIKEKEKDEK